MQSVSGAFKDMYAGLPVKRLAENFSKGFYINVEYLSQSVSSTHSFFVQHTMSLANPTLNDWACKKKLFPWVAIAARIDVGLTIASAGGALQRLSDY